MKTTIFAILAMALSVLAAPAAAGQSAEEINACKAEILQTNNLTEAQARQLPVGFPIEYGGSFYPLAPGSNPWALCRDEIIPSEAEQALRDEITALEFQVAELQEENQGLRQQLTETNIVSSQISTQIAAENVALNASGSSGGGNTNIVSSQLSSQIAAGNLEINQPTPTQEVSAASPNLPILEWIVIGLLLLGLITTSILFWRYREKMESIVSHLRSEIRRQDATQQTLSQTIVALRESHGALSEAHDRLHNDHAAAMREVGRLSKDTKVLREEGKEYERILAAHSAETPMFELEFDESYGTARPVTLIYDGTTGGGHTRLRMAHGTSFLFVTYMDLLLTLTTEPSLEILAHTRPGLDIARIVSERKAFQRKITRIRTDKKAKTERIAKEWLSKMFRKTPSPRTFRFSVMIHPDFPVNTVPDPVDIAAIKKLVPTSAAVQ